MDTASTNADSNGAGASTNTTPPVVVIGAGFAGLAAAVRLVEAGRRVIVLEATKAGGGRSRSFGHDSGLELDNGQHLMMGCYHETLAFLRTIGTDGDVAFQRNLSIDMVKPGGRRVKLRCPHCRRRCTSRPACSRCGGWARCTRLSALRMGMFLRGEVVRPDDNETCDAWLHRLGQTEGIRGAFWDPLIWAVLNDDPLIASAAMLVAVLERAFLGTRDASRLGVPRVPLSRLYVDGATQWLRSRDAELRFGSSVRAIEIDDRGVSGVVLRGGERIATREVVTAVPPFALLECLPEAVLRTPVLQDVAKLTTSPIINLWLFLERPLFDDVPFLGLVNSPLHWMFARPRIEGRDPSDTVLLNCTMSGARGFVDDSPETLVELWKSEMTRYFPAARPIVRQAKVVKEKRATISHAAGTYHFRPETRAPVRGLYFAGDWVRTGIPATIESAVCSGHMAAAAVLER
ncbi:MAG: FAD-dependent oxidoreductase [Deltaproteobacteria bacterium]|nr:FAD-dependent oxidoreductase [Deltaproteobacteria bacterium]